MKPSERALTRYLRSRLGAFSLVALAFLGMLISAGVAQLPAVATGRGLVTGISSASFIGRGFSLIGALTLTGGIMGAMALINSTFNLLRTSSILFIGVFAFMEAASPIVTTRLSSGCMVALVVLGCMALMYSVYQQPVTGTKRIFLVFTLLSAGSMGQYAFVGYWPIFLAGCAQMRCFSFRTLPAAIIGLAVPWWIGWGFGWITSESITFPTGLSVFSQLDSIDATQLIAVLILTVIAGFAFTLTNMVKIYSYNARSRSFTGLLVTVTIATLILTMIDFANITAYLPLLNCCVAYQAALSFRINAENRGYIAVCTLLGIYFILFAWSLL